MGSVRFGKARDMEMADLLSPEAVIVRPGAAGKRRVLRYMADVAAEAYGLSSDIVLEALLEREKLGTTGVGGGVALPHARLDGLSAIRGAFARLETASPFEAVDDQPVDLVFLLLAPKEAGADHLKALARVSRLFRKNDIREKLRKATSAEALFALLMDQDVNA